MKTRSSRRRTDEPPVSRACHNATAINAKVGKAGNRLERVHRHSIDHRADEHAPADQGDGIESPGQKAALLEQQGSGPNDQKRSESDPFYSGDRLVIGKFVKRAQRVPKPKSEHQEARRATSRSHDEVKRQRSEDAGRGQEEPARKRGASQVCISKHCVRLASRGYPTKQSQSLASGSIATNFLCQ